jgi:Ca2+-binding RTX toxin-like protein
MMALVSVGKPDILVTYDFNDSFTASAAGNNYWGTGSYATGAGDTFIGSEYNGVLNFSGSFDSISFSTAPGENWHGFNFASYSTSVPEPAPLALLALGLAGLGLSRRKAK